MNNSKKYHIQILLIMLAISSFTFPFIVSKIQDNKISSNIITINLEKLKLDNILISNTTDLSLICDIFTNDDKIVVDFNYYNELFPSEIIVKLNKELDTLKYYNLLPNIEFELIDTPRLLMYSTDNGANILVWEYYFFDTNKNIMKLYYHSKTDKILLLEYETDDTEKYGDVTVSIFGTIGYNFDYIPTVLYEIIEEKERIKTTILLKEEYYEINIYTR